MQYQMILVLIILAGLVKISIESYKSISKKKYSLDYIAFFAMILSLYSQEYIAGTVIAIMFIGGELLEDFASKKAHNALKSLGDNIPKKCHIDDSGSVKEVLIQKIVNNDIIFVKRGELIPLDGVILSPDISILDMSNLTGEVGPVNIKNGTFVKSGSVNIGDMIRIRVVGDFSSSSYHKIVKLVDDAKLHPSKTVRLSEKANIYFTIITFIIAILVYIFTGEFGRILAILVIATPCPLIIAAPVAFVSGMSRAARNGIIIRRPVALEIINRADSVFFDKTGTLTLGEPVFLSKEISDDVLSIAASLEIHSLHPIAKTIVNEAKRRGINFPISTDVKEIIGKGISAKINGESYMLSGVELTKDGKEIAHFHFDDVLKGGALDIIHNLKDSGVRTVIITGDKEENAKKIFGNIDVDVYAGQSPEDKYILVEKEIKEGKTVIMIGDGLNDAPALAKADVGIVFSGTENGASIDAAHVAILGAGLEKLDMLFDISKHTVSVARQSIYGGICLSIVGMTFAAFGYLQPIHGAILQECIDVVVILNALRALIRL